VGASISTALLLLTGEPVNIWLSVCARAMLGRDALGMSKGLARWFVELGRARRGFVPGVATGLVVSTAVDGSASGSVRYIVRNFSTTSRSRSGWAWSGFSAMCFRYVPC
jgi:hypothetical protein